MSRIVKTIVICWETDNGRTPLLTLYPEAVPDEHCEIHLPVRLDRRSFCSVEMLRKLGEAIRAALNQLEEDDFLVDVVPEDDHGKE